MARTKSSRSLLAVAMPLILAFGAPAAAALSPADETSIEDVRKESRQLMSALKSYTAEQRDQAIQEVEIAIIRLDNRIDELQSRVDRQWDGMTQAARTEARKNLRALQKQRIELAEWYGNLKGSSSSAWGEIKQGFSDAYRDLARAWEEALNEFGSSGSKQN